MHGLRCLTRSVRSGRWRVFAGIDTHKDTLADAAGGFAQVAQLVAGHRVVRLGIELGSAAARPLTESWRAGSDPLDVVTRLL